MLYRVIQGLGLRVFISRNPKLFNPSGIRVWGTEALGFRVKIRV